MNRLEFITEFREAGEPVLAPELFGRAWSEFLELRLTDKQTWLNQSLSTIQRFNRYEIGMLCNGTPIGGLTVTSDHDPHVGRCLSVMSQYVLPEFRNQGVSLRSMRYVIRLARELGYPVVAFTHRVGDWKYLTTYRRT